MMFRACLLAASALVWSAGPVLAHDAPFGADALSQLERDATVIVVTSNARALPVTKVTVDDHGDMTVHAFAVRASEVLKGAVDTGSELRVGMIEESDAPSAKELANAILFLQPMSAEALAKAKIVAKGPAYVAVNGHYGIVAADVPGRKDAVRAYVQAARAGKLTTEQVLQWTQKHLASRDPFLQRSAVVDLHFANREAAAVKQLAEALVSDVALPETKRSVIVALEHASGPEVATHLKAFAENPAMPKGLRTVAVKAFKTLPGGDDQLRKWGATKDGILAPAAQSALRGLEGQPKR
jgi:hypothetical protein